MNITLIFGPLAFLSICYTLVQGQVWQLTGAEVVDRAYKNQVSLERKEDGKTWYIHAIPKNSASNVPEVVNGPFEMRGFGPYSMLINRLWLNTSDGENYVSVTFITLTAVWDVYHILNPYHSPSFPNDFIIKRLVLNSSKGNPALVFEEHEPKALDSFTLETSTAVDSRARSYVVHNVEGNQEPILIFHSLECEMTVDGGRLMLSIKPLNSPTNYPCSIELETPSFAGKIHEAYTTLKALGFENNLQDLEALPRNTYPTLPPHYDQDELSNVGQNWARKN